MRAYKSLESADALIALRAVYFARFPKLERPTWPYHHRRRLMEEIRDGVDDHTQAVDSKLIGRQAFFLDEPLRQTGDGRVFRAPLVQGGEATSARGECINEALEDDKEQKDKPNYGWRVDDNDWKGVWEYQKQCALERLPARLVMAPSRGVVRVDYDTPSGLGILYGTREETTERHQEADELYKQYIDEQECC